MGRTMDKTDGSGCQKWGLNIAVISEIANTEVSSLWTSETMYGNTKVFQDTPMLILATSPGPGGAGNVLSLAETSAPHFAGSVMGSISVPSFHKNYDVETNEIINPQIRAEIEQGVQRLGAAA